MPNSEHDSATAILIYLGGEQARLLSKATSEDYFFNGLGGDYGSYRKEAQAKRISERQELAKRAYQAGELIEPNKAPLLIEHGYRVPALTGWINPHDDFMPDGMKAGELRAFDDSLLQAFYTPMTSTESRQEFPKLTAVRMLFSNALGLNEAINMPPCQHIHRLVHDMPVVWVVGYENALAALNRFPDFTVKEAFNLEHLFKFVGSGRGSAYDLIAGNSCSIYNRLEDSYLALTVDQTSEFTTIAERGKGEKLRPFKEVEYCFIELAKGECFNHE
jgi:hypothetical protein